jgi:hypothetical protein
MIEPEKFICDICKEEFNSASELEKHKAGHLHLTPGEEDREIRGDIGAAGLPTAPQP